MIDYTIDPAQELIVITGNYGTPEQWVELLGRLLADPRRQPGFGILRDLRGASKNADVQMIVGIIEVVRRMWPQLQASRAAVVTTEAIDTAAVSQVLAAERQIPLRAFTSYAAAVDWLRDG